mmetsp:Transcript_684/g.1086  ORF Transcript_684/g.1086 Transcript_684/m.1086 type:complete len:95 (+) Transcript_684:2-286(+)
MLLMMWEFRFSVEVEEALLLHLTPNRASLPVLVLAFQPGSVEASIAIDAQSRLICRSPRLVIVDAANPAESTESAHLSQLGCHMVGSQSPLCKE